MNILTPFAIIRRMKWSQRVEVWGLLVLVLGGLLWVFTHRGSGGAAEASASSNSAGEKVDATVKVLRCTITRDHDHARLDIDARVRNESASSVLLQSPAIRLLATSDREVPSFFLPFDPQPEVAARSTQDVQLRYWLAAPDLGGPLTLELAGHRAEVKSPKPFDMKSLREAGQATFSSTQW